MTTLAATIKQLLKEAEGTQIVHPNASQGDKTTNKEVATAPTGHEPVVDATDESLVENDEALSEAEKQALKEFDANQGGAGNIDFGTTGTPQNMGPGAEGTIVPATSVEEMKESCLTTVTPILEAALVKVAPEAISALFEGQGELSEDFKKKVSGLFEASVNEKLKASLNEAVKGVVEVVGAHYTKRLSEEMAIVEAYADDVATDWLKENQVALEQNHKTALAESFMGELKRVFLEHFIEIPESKVDLFEAFQKRITKLEEAANVEIGKTQSAQKALKESQKSLAVVKFTKGMTEVQASKVTTLSEGVEFTTEEEFVTKLKPLAEAAKPTAPAAPAGAPAAKTLLEDKGATVPTETPQAPTAPEIDPIVALAVRAAQASRSNV